MNNGFLISALAIISALTTLTVEGLKKLIGEKIKSYNLLAVIVAVVITLALSAGYIIYTATAITPQIVIEVIALVFLAFLSATTSFDKVKQLIEQLMR